MFPPFTFNVIVEYSDHHQSLGEKCCCITGVDGSGMDISEVHADDWIVQKQTEQLNHREVYRDGQAQWMKLTLTCSPWISARWAFSASSSRLLSASSF